MIEQPVISEAEVYGILEEVKDPEIPVISVIDLGIIRNIKINRKENEPSGKQEIEITITPTYSGCPALDVINMDIRLKLMEKGFRDVRILQQLSPAWTTDWISESGKQKLKEYGISPPNPKQQFCNTDMFQIETVACPRCNSFHTSAISQFGSTACKALYRCLDCQEAFDYFKCH